MEESKFSQLRHEGIKSTLRQCSLFSDLDEQSLNSVADTCILKSLEKGEILFLQGESADGFFVVQSGIIGLFGVRPDGKEQVICLFRENDSFAEATLVALEAYPANAKAVTSAQVILVRKNEFKALIGRNPDLALRMLSSMSMHLKYLVQLIEDRKFTDIEGRFANWLIKFQQSGHEDTGSILELPVSKKILASQLGVAGETLSR